MSFQTQLYLHQCFLLTQFLFVALLRILKMNTGLITFRQTGMQLTMEL